MNLVACRARIVAVRHAAQRRMPNGEPRKRGEVRAFEDGSGQNPEPGTSKPCCSCSRETAYEGWAPNTRLCCVGNRETTAEKMAICRERLFVANVRQRTFT